MNRTGESLNTMNEEIGTTNTAAPRVQILQPGGIASGGLVMGRRPPGRRVTVKTAVSPAPGPGEAQENRPKKRVAAYARTSTDSADQETSFEAQQTHFRSVIDANPDYELVDIYADEESGTRAFKRENFMRMIRDCEEGRIDLILTKSISRWARNTLDSLNYIRKLKNLGIPVIFTKEGLNTMDQNGEIMLTLMSSIAQQESASISQNVQLGVRYHYQEGKVCSGVYRLLGYDRTRSGTLEIIPEEADIIRRIYREYLDGYSMGHIAKRLTEDGVDGTKTTNTGLEVSRNWNEQGIAYILMNEKYSGDLLLQKFYTVDFLTKKVAVNNGQLPQYYIENSHPPIIPKEIFLQVQSEIARRKKARIRYMRGTALSGRVFCAECGSPFWVRKDKRNGSVIWRCGSCIDRKRFPGITCENIKGIRDEVVKQAVAEALNEAAERSEELIRLEERIRWGGLKRADDLLGNLETQMGETEQALWETPDTMLEQKLADLQETWLNASEQRTEYANALVQIRNLQERIAAINGERKTRKESTDGSCRNPDDFWKLTKPDYEKGAVEQFSEDDCFRLVEKIIISDDTIKVIFKAGIETEVARG